jgi:hypothetical protein
MKSQERAEFARTPPGILKRLGNREACGARFERVHLEIGHAFRGFTLQAAGIIIIGGLVMAVEQVEDADAELPAMR